MKNTTIHRNNQKNHRLSFCGKFILLGLALLLSTLCLAGCIKHQYGELEVIKPPTCTEAGEVLMGCECGKTRTETREPLGHRFSNRLCIVCGAPEEDGGFVFYYSEGVCEVAYKGFPQGRLEVPAVSPEDVPVTGLRDNAFSGCSELTEIVLPEGLLKIGSAAFSGCTALTEVRLPSTVTNILSYAFYGCERLSTLYLSDDLSSIGTAAFINCTSLATIRNVPRSPLTIAERVFHNTAFLNNRKNWQGGLLYLDVHLLRADNNLTSFQVREGTVSVAAGAFTGFGPIHSLTLPASLQHFDSLFLLRDVEHLYLPTLEVWCGNRFTEARVNPVFKAENVYLGGELLTDLVIPADLKEIPAYAFSGYEKLRSITFPGGACTIGTDAFRYCNGVEELHLTDLAYWCKLDLNHIPDDELYGSKGKVTRAIALFLNGEPLHSLRIPDGIDHLSPRPLAIVKGLTDLILPTTVKTVARFPLCDLVSVYYEGTKEDCTATGLYLRRGFPDEIKLHYYPPAGAATTTPGYFWNGHTVNGTLYTWHNCFSEDAVTCTMPAFCAECNALILPANGHTFVDDICTFCGQSNTLAFERNDDDTYTLVGFRAACTQTTLYVPAFHNGLPVKGIGEQAFRENRLLRTLVIEEGVREIGALAFEHCTALSIITLPSTIEKIGERAFSGNTANPSVYADSLTHWCSVSFGDPFANPLSSGGKLFLGGELMNTLILTATSPVLPDYAFYGYRHLDTLVIEKDAPPVGKEAFIYTSLKSVTLPSDMTELPDRLFYGCDKLVNVNLPEGLSTIGNGAFSGCSSLCSISLPEGVSTIGNAAFLNCVLLADINFPDGLTAIESNAFSGCRKLTSFAPSKGLLTIGNDAFSGCIALASVSLPEGLYTIGDRAFQNCKDLSTLQLSADLQGIGFRAFYGCTALKSVTLPEGVTVLGDSAFEYCENLAEIKLPSTLTTVGERCFVKTALTHVALPDSLTRLGRYAFANCAVLCTVTLPEGLTTLEEYVFSNCILLEAVEIPRATLTVEPHAFEYCSSLSSLTVASGNERYHAAGNCLIETATRTLTAGCVTSVIPSDGSVTVIAAFAFCGLPITSVVVPNCVEEIECGAFTDCTSLLSISLPFVGVNRENALTHFAHIFGAENPPYVSREESYVPKSLRTVTLTDGGIIGQSAFRNCTTITELILPDEPIYFHRSAFVGCTGLQAVKIGNLHNWYNHTFADQQANPLYYAHHLYVDGELIVSVQFPEGMESVPDAVFINCKSLGSVTFPESVKTIGNRALAGCDSLTSITFPESVVTIGIGALAECTSLTSVTLPSGLTEMASSLFRNCTSLARISIPESVTYIGDCAFADCTALEEIRLPTALTAVGNEVFSKCKKLREVTLPDSVTTIGISAFSNCTALTRLVCGKSVKIIRDNAFANCTELQELHLPAALDFIGLSVFTNTEKLSDIYYGGTEAMWKVLRMPEYIREHLFSLIHFESP